MKALTSAIMAGLLSASNAPAQPASTATQITAEQRGRIKEHVATENRPSVTAPSSFSPNVGATLPEGLELYWMRSEAGVNRYRYVVVDGHTLIVEPYTRRIVEALN